MIRPHQSADESYGKNRHHQLFAIAAFLLLIGSMSCRSMTKQASTSAGDQAYQVSGQVVQRKPYCGGAKPNQAILDRTQIPQPYPNKTFYLKHGESNRIKAKVVAQFTTDAQGEFSLQLPKGTYVLLQAEQLQKLNIEALQSKHLSIDAKCLESWWKQPYHVLNVKDANITDLNFSFQKRCHIDSDLPCITYTGPPPH